MEIAANPELLELQEKLNKELDRSAYVIKLVCVEGDTFEFEVLNGSNLVDIVRVGTFKRFEHECWDYVKFILANSRNQG